MKILIAEDDVDVASLYNHVLVHRGHKVTLAHNGEACLKIYSKRLQEVHLNKPAYSRTQPFDTVILDYKMPDRNGLEIAKEILAINHHQRIIFVSAYVRQTLSISIKRLNLPVELLQKPVSNKVLIDTIEDRAIYEELKNLKFDIETIKKADFRHEQLKRFLYTLKTVLNNRNADYNDNVNR